MKVSEAQHEFLRVVRDFADPDGGWAEVELQFHSRRSTSKFPAHLEVSLVQRVASALERKGLVTKNPEGRSGPELTDAGRTWLEKNP